ncbi:unnamed protein product [Absidia cylindrospora]
MDSENYHHSYSGKNKYLLYFTETPLKSWNYPSFETWFSKKRNSPSKATLVGAYKQCLTFIQNDNNTPSYIKNRVNEIIEEFATKNTATIPHNTYNFNEGFHQLSTTVTTAPIQYSTNRSPLNQNYHHYKNNTNRSSNMNNNRSNKQQQQQQQKRPQSILQIGQEELVTKNDNNGKLHATKKIRLYVSKAGACLDTSGSDNDGSYIDTSNSDDDELNLTHGKLDYLVGPGELTVNTEVMSDPLFSSWILNDTNVSSIFLSYRNRVVNKAKQYQHLTMMDTLALNFIFLINIDKPTPAFLSRNEWNNITLAMMTTNPIARFQHQQGQWYNNSRNVQER